MRIVCDSSILLAPIVLTLGCGGAGGTGPASAASGGGESEQPTVESSGQTGEPDVEDTGSAGHEATSEPTGPPSVPTSEGDCMEFHLGQIECGKSAGGVGPTEEARMRAAAESGCRAAIEDRDNPVTAFVLRLWARCKDLPCADAEACVRSGMIELSAPPGPYVPSNQ